MRLYYIYIDSNKAPTLPVEALLLPLRMPLFCSFEIIALVGCGIPGSPFTTDETGIQNKTDGTWIIAKRNDAEGVYYVTGHTDKEADATVFTPVTMGKSYGHIMVKGLEEDTYTITETQTANGYTLLKNAINVTITVKENTSNTCNVYAKDVLGVLQNDPHYSFDGGEDLKLANIPQRALSHNYPTASATVDKNEVTMLEDNGSANAEVPLTVKNTKGFDLPKTGDHGTWMYSLVGILLMSTAAGVIVLTVKKKNGR